MDMIPSGRSYSWISRFAIEHVAARADLQTVKDFPHDIWQKMGDAGFFQIGIANDFGGSGGGSNSLLKQERFSFAVVTTWDWHYHGFISK
jgi:alkylation response protein AidB-like acyl-CoA dehydrogenase